MFLAMLVKPFLFLAVLAVIWPIKRAFELWMPDGKVKRVLLHRVGGQKARG